MPVPAIKLNSYEVVAFNKGADWEKEQRGHASRRGSSTFAPSLWPSEQARSVLLQAARYRHAIEEPDTVNYLLMSLESTWLSTEQFEEGRAFFADYISRYPRDSAAYRRRAAILWYSGELQQAIEDYSRFLELKSMNGRGFALGGVAEFERAMEEFDLSIKLSPENAWVYHNRARISDSAGHSEQAKADYQLALKRRKPALSPLRREQVRSRLTQLELNVS